MTEQHTNWSQSLRFSPRRVIKPQSEVELLELVQEVANIGGTIRPIGKGHSSTQILATDDTLVSLERFSGVESIDRERCEAWAKPGTTLKELNKVLLESGLAVHNLGDVNVQFIGGAIGTGTHGTGKMLGNLSTMLQGVRMITADGNIIERHLESDPEFIQAARVSLGVLGLFTSLRLKVLPRYKLHRQEWCTSVEACMAHLDELIDENRHFDFYWYPRRDEIKLRTHNFPGETPNLPYATLLEEKTGWAPEVIPKERHILFNEMEYALPLEAGPEVFLKVRQRVLEKHRREVAWRVLYRTVAPDDAMLSPSYQRPTVTIAILHNASLPFWDYFNDIEPIFREYGGRPHWGKKHTLRAAELAPLYPQWDKFKRIRTEVDPDGTFMTTYLQELLGIDGLESYQVGDTGVESK